MAKPKITYKIETYGIYTGWDKHSKDLPKIKRHTDTIPARVDIEFGYVLSINKAKGKKLAFCIDHPPFCDEEGNVRPPFTGEVYVGANQWQFFLGDTIWEPVHDKVGPWRLTVTLDGKTIADKTFQIVEDVLSEEERK